MSKTILILGASYAGLTVAHALLKKTLTTVKNYKVILVSPNTAHYWNLATVRAIIPDQFNDAQLFGDIPSGFSHYPKEQFEFVQGTATSLDPEKKTAVVSTETGTHTLSYELLVIATGSRTSDSLPWKASNLGIDETKRILRETQLAVKKAKSIVLGGAGPTGVEAAAELGHEYGTSKEITLISSSSSLLPGTEPSNIGSIAEKQLRRLHVNLLKETKVLSATRTADGKYALALSNQTTKTVDLYLPTTGTIPNTSFLPAELLSSNGRIPVDAYLRVLGAKNAYAVGDAADLDPAQCLYADKQANHLAANLHKYFLGKEMLAYKESSEKDRMLGVALGKKKGTGMMGKKSLPGVVIWWFKSRTLGTERMAGLVNGTKV